MKKFIEILKNDFPTIMKDFKKETGIELSSLSIQRIGDKKNVSTILVSNYLDNQIGILSNNFKKVVVRFSVCFKDETTFIITSNFDYEHRDSGRNSVSILNKDQLMFVLKYEIKNEKLYLIPKLNYIKDCIKIVVKHNDNQFDDIYIDRDIYAFQLNHILSELDNIKEVIIYSYNNGEWEVLKNLNNEMVNIINKYL